MNASELPRVYLDHGATTPVDPEVLAEMLPYFMRDFGNPSSRGHRFGWDALSAVERGRQQVAALLNAEPDEIFFTSGATESNFIGLFGSSAPETGQTRRHIVSSPLEHKSVLCCLESLERRGFELSWVVPRKDGRTHVEDVLRVIRSDTCAVSIMWVNNEIGVVNPVIELARELKSRYPDVLLHSDATQAAGKVAIDLQDALVDLLSLSAHKIYGPKGVGALYIRKTMQQRIATVMRGGGQENGMRGGTLNVPGIVGLGKACQLSGDRFASDNARIHDLAQRLYHLIAEGFPEVAVNGSRAQRIGGNLSLTFPGINGETLLKQLSDEIAVSSGSACSAGSSDVSHVLHGIGLSDELARSTVRFGVGRDTTVEEIDRAAAAVLRAITTIAPTRAPAPMPIQPSNGAGNDLMLRRIATVVNGIEVPEYIEWRNVDSRILLDPEWAAALEGLQEYSHLVVVYWMDQVATCKLTHVPQSNYQDVPEVGIFACRCPYRPNPIAVTTVELLEVSGLELRVRGLDAVNGTPVIDIKPYTPQMDAVEGEVRVPGWVSKLVY